MADLTAPGPNDSSLYESTSNELEISSSDESLSSNEEESSTVFQLKKSKVELHH